MNNWKEICKRLQKKHKNEGELEVRFEDCIDFILGWPEINLARQRPIQSGHRSIWADLVLLDDNDRPLIIFEMKKQDISITDHEVGQLASYMRLELARFGFLVSNRISLYYDKQEGEKKAERVLTLSFEEINNEDGIQLINMLKKSTFDSNRLSEFCIEYLQKRKTLEKNLKQNRTIDNLAAYKNLDTLDEKITALIALYASWQEDGSGGNKNEINYYKNLENNCAWIIENIFNIDLNALQDEEFIILFREFSSRLPNMGRWLSMWNKNDSEVLAIRKDFVRAVTQLVEIPERRRFYALADFTGTGGKYLVKHLKRAFWSEMIRIKFPDVPLLNDKTENFFKAIEFYIGVTYEEKLENISAFYKRFETKEITLYKLSHLEHFAMAKNAGNKVGQQFMRENFPKYREMCP